MDGVEVVRVGADDWRELRAVRLAALTDAPDAFLTTLAEAERRPEEEWHRQAAERVQFLARVDGQTAGMVGLFPSEHDPGTVQLVGMWTAPEARRTGVGAALVGAVLDWARSEGAARVVLDVAPGNDGAAAFYERLGFEPTEDPALRAGMPVACDTRFVLQLS